MFTADLYCFISVSIRDEVMLICYIEIQKEDFRFIFHIIGNHNSALLLHFEKEISQNSRCIRSVLKFIYFFRSESKICLMWLIVRCTGKKPETTSALKLIGIRSCEKKKKRLNTQDCIATLKFSICVKNKFR